MLIFMVGCALAGAGMVGQVQDPRLLAKAAANAIDADLSEFAWIAGDWKGKGAANEYEELWLPAMGGSMVGIFRLISGEKLVSVSALNLQQDGTKVKMLLRGLTPDLNPAGEKTTVMVLVSKSNGTADFVNQFEGVQPQALHVSNADGGLHVTVESLVDGTVKKTELNFKLAKQ